jgi:hypothetical protein
MSSSAVSLTPLHSKKQAPGKKRRPNFRPIVRKGSKATKPSALATPDETIESIDNANEEETGMSVVDSPTVPTSVLTKRAESAVRVSLSKAAVTHSPPSKQAPKRGKKRKTIGVSIGSTRAARPETSTEKLSDENTLHEEHFPASEPLRKSTPKAAITKQGSTIPIVETAIIPEDTSGGPNLKNYCSTFRSKRGKDQPRVAVAAAPEPELDQANAPTLSAGPVVKVVNGEIVLQESSMVVNASSKEVEEFPVVEEEAQLAVVGASYNSFTNRKKPQHWNVVETQLFYEALRQVGLDFGTMEAYFENRRTRKQLKRKYQKESSKNPHLIEAALDPTARRGIDLSVFDVTAEDIAKQVELENTQEPDRETRLLPVDNDRELIEVVEEDELTVTETERASPSLDSALQQTLLWGKDEAELVDTRPALDDHMFDDEAQAEETVKVTLISNVNKTNKKKKPKFRSRKTKK